MTHLNVVYTIARFLVCEIENEADTESQTWIHHENWALKIHTIWYVYYVHCACVKWNESRGENHIAVQTSQCVSYCVCWIVVHNGNGEAKPTKIYYRSLSSLHRMRLTLFCTVAVFCSRQMLVCFINAIGSKLCNLVSCLCNQRSFDGGKPEKLSNFLMQVKGMPFTSSVCQIKQMKWYSKIILKKCVSNGFVYFSISFLR